MAEKAGLEERQRAEVAQRQDQLTALRSSAEQKEAEAVRLQELLAQAQDKVHRVEELEGSCARLHEAQLQLQTQNEQLAAAKAQAQEAVQQITEQLQEAKTRVHELEQAKEEMTQSQEQGRSVTEKLEDAQTRIAELEKQLESEQQLRSRANDHRALTQCCTEPRARPD